LWGKGILCLLVAIFTSLSLFFCVASFSFSSISFFEGGCGFEDIKKNSEIQTAFFNMIFNARVGSAVMFPRESMLLISRISSKEVQDKKEFTIYFRR